MSKPPTDVSGAFSTVNAPYFNGRTLRILYGVSQVTLEVGNADFLAADFTEDGIVNGNDLARWRSGFGTGSTHVQGNADGDGDVDGSDFLAWQRQLGSPGLVGITTEVPEPATIAYILSIGLSAAPAIARTRRR